MRVSARVEEASVDLALKLRLNEAQRLQLVDDYYLFLDKAAGAEMDVRPTQAVDQLWHCHILDTRAYAEDCEAWFGGFVHHRPCRPDEATLNHPLANCGGSGRGWGV